METASATRVLAAAERAAAKEAACGLTVEYLKSILRYNPKTGIFTWRKHFGRVTAGTIAGSLNRHGRIMIKIDGVGHPASRLAWFYMIGEWPKCEIDHEDTDSSNNRWRNLREATRYQNSVNVRVRAHSASQLKGVRFHKGRWVAYIVISKKWTYLGRFDTKEIAHAAYASAARIIHGSFARAA